MSSWDKHELPPLPAEERNTGPSRPWYVRYRIVPGRLSSFTLIRAFILFLLVGGGLSTGGLYIYFKDLGLFQIDEDYFRPLLEWKPSDNTKVYDKKGKKMAELFSSYHVYVPYEKLPESLVNSLIAIEDRNFKTHNGTDPKAMLRALLVYLSSGGRSFSQGASTITQQLVRHFFLPREKTINRKVREIFLALQLEKILGKEKILEIYANVLFLGHGAYGVGAAAKRYFNKNLRKLRAHELALIAGLFQSPSRYNPHRYPAKAKKRQKKVLAAMVESGYLSRLEAKYWGKKPLRYKSYVSSWGKEAPYFVDYVNDQARALLKTRNLKNKGLRIYTTLDPEVQKLAEAALKDSGELFQKTEDANRKMNPTLPEDFSLEAAMLVTDPVTGEIQAMAGGRDYAASKFNRCTQALRQPGSAFKPVVYSLGLQKGFRWSDTIYVSPITLAGNYRPRSPADDYMTQTTLLRAFYRSMNSPTMELGQSLGVDQVIEHAARLGIRNPVRKEFGSLLGSSEVTMGDLARLNGVFATLGHLVSLSAIKKISDHTGQVLYVRPPPEGRMKRVMDARVAYMMVSAMKQVLYRGTGWRYSELGAWAAGKTGTSNDARDNWFAGFTPDMVSVVWVGTDLSYNLVGNAQGATMALPVWAKFMNSWKKGRKPKGFKIPDGIKSVRIDPVNGKPDQEGVRMWFFKHNVPEAGKRSAGNPRGTPDSFRNPF